MTEPLPTSTPGSLLFRPSPDPNHPGYYVLGHLLTQEQLEAFKVLPTNTIVGAHRLDITQEKYSGWVASELDFEKNFKFTLRKYDWGCLHHAEGPAEITYYGDGRREEKYALYGWAYSQAEWEILKQIPPIGQEFTLPSGEKLFRSYRYNSDPPDLSRIVPGTLEHEVYLEGQSHRLICSSTLQPLHCTTGPAQTSWLKPDRDRYFLLGHELTREQFAGLGAPISPKDSGWRIIDSDFTEKFSFTLEHYHQGRLHREDGPARTVFGLGEKQEEYWYLGFQLTQEQFEAYRVVPEIGVSRNYTGWTWQRTGPKRFVLTHMENGRASRKDGPAVIAYQVGHSPVEQYWLRGRFRGDSYTAEEWTQLMLKEKLDAVIAQKLETMISEDKIEESVLSDSDRAQDRYRAEVLDVLGEGWSFDKGHFIFAYRPGQACYGLPESEAVNINICSLFCLLETKISNRLRYPALPGAREERPGPALNQTYYTYDKISKCFSITHLAQGQPPAEGCYKEIYKFGADRLRLYCWSSPAGTRFIDLSERDYMLLIQLDPKIPFEIVQNHWNNQIEYVTVNGVKFSLEEAVKLTHTEQTLVPTDEEARDRYRAELLATLGPGWSFEKGHFVFTYKPGVSSYLIPENEAGLIQMGSLPNWSNPGAVRSTHLRTLIPDSNGSSYLYDPKHKCLSILGMAQGQPAEGCYHELYQVGAGRERTYCWVGPDGTRLTALIESDYDLLKQLDPKIPFKVVQNSWSHRIECVKLNSVNFSLQNATKIVHVDVDQAILPKDHEDYAFDPLRNGVDLQRTGVFWMYDDSRQELSRWILAGGTLHSIDAPAYQTFDKQRHQKDHYYYRNVCCTSEEWAQYCQEEQLWRQKLPLSDLDVRARSARLNGVYLSFEDLDQIFTRSRAPEHNNAIYVKNHLVYRYEAEKPLADGLHYAYNFDTKLLSSFRVSEGRFHSILGPAYTCKNAGGQEVRQEYYIRGHSLDRASWLNFVEQSPVVEKLQPDGSWERSSENPVVGGVYRETRKIDGILECIETFKCLNLEKKLERHSVQGQPSMVIRSYRGAEESQECEWHLHGLKVPEEYAQAYWERPNSNDDGQFVDEAGQPITGLVVTSLGSRTPILSVKHLVEGWLQDTAEEPAETLIDQTGIIRRNSFLKGIYRSNQSLGSFQNLSEPAQTQAYRQKINLLKPYNFFTPRSGQEIKDQLGTQLIDLQDYDIVSRDNLEERDGKFHRKDTGQCLTGRHIVTDTDSCELVSFESGLKNGAAILIDIYGGHTEIFYRHNWKHGCQRTVSKNGEYSTWFWYGISLSEESFNRLQNLGDPNIRLDAGHGQIVFSDNLRVPLYQLKYFDPSAKKKGPHRVWDAQSRTLSSFSRNEAGLLHSLAGPAETQDTGAQKEVKYYLEGQLLSEEDWKKESVHYQFIQKELGPNFISRTIEDIDGQKVYRLETTDFIGYYTNPRCHFELNACVLHSTVGPALVYKESAPAHINKLERYYLEGQEYSAEQWAAEVAARNLPKAAMVGWDSEAIGKKINVYDAEGHKIAHFQLLDFFSPEELNTDFEDQCRYDGDLFYIIHQNFRKPNLRSMVRNLIYPGVNCSTAEAKSALQKALAILKKYAADRDELEQEIFGEPPEVPDLINFPTSQETVEIKSPEPPLLKEDEAELPAVLQASLKEEILVEVAQEMSEMAEAGYRVAAKQLGRMVCHIIGTRAPAAQNFLKTPLGRALIFQAVGWILVAHPTWHNNERVAKLAAELRAEGLTIIGEDLIQSLLGWMLETSQSADQIIRPEASNLVYEESEAAVPEMVQLVEHQRA